MAYQEQDNKARQIAKGLGWFSIGLGIAELAAPRTMEKVMGLRDRDQRRNVLRFYGVREIAAGVGILTNEQKGAWLWSRVAGDALDLASLGSAYTARDAKKGRLTFATLSVMGVTALDMLCARQLTRSWMSNGSERVIKSIIIDRPAEEIYGFWRNLSNMPRFMKFVESVEPRGERRARYRVTLPNEGTLDLETEIVEDRPGRLISWRPTGDYPFPPAGTVRFEAAPGNRGTLVRVELNPEGGAMQAGAHIGKAFGVPQTLIENNLRALKQILETGEVVQSDSSIFPGMHAAQPPEHVPEFAGVR
jgi:uncharacterized membrane protein